MLRGTPYVTFSVPFHRSFKYIKYSSNIQFVCRHRERYTTQDQEIKNQYRLMKKQYLKYNFKNVLLWRRLKTTRAKYFQKQKHCEVMRCFVDKTITRCIIMYLITLRVMHNTYCVFCILMYYNLHAVIHCIQNKQRRRNYMFHIILLLYLHSARVKYE